MKLKANHRGLHFFVGVVLVRWRRQTLLDKKLARLVAMSDVRTDERLGYELTRTVAIGDIIRELPPVDDKGYARRLIAALDWRCGPCWQACSGCVRAADIELHGAKDPQAHF